MLNIQLNVEDVTSLSIALFYLAYLIGARKATFCSAGKAIIRCTSTDLIGGPTAQDILGRPIERLLDCRIFLDILLRELPLHVHHDQVAALESRYCSFPKGSIVPSKRSTCACEGSIESSACDIDQCHHFRRSQVSAKHSLRRRDGQYLPPNTQPRPSAEPLEVSSPLKAQSGCQCLPLRNYGVTERGKDQRAMASAESKTTAGRTSYNGKQQILGSGMFKILPAKAQLGQSPEAEVASDDKAELGSMPTPLACFVGKYNPDAVECHDPRKRWWTLRALLRSSHLNEHRRQNIITKAQHDQMKAKLRGVAVNGTPDIGRQIRAWRECFVILYPEFRTIMDGLNPYIGELLLPGVLDPRQKEQQLRDRRLRQANQFASYAEAAGGSPRRSVQPAGQQSMPPTAATTTVLNPAAPPFQPTRARLLLPAFNYHATASQTPHHARLDTVQHQPRPSAVPPSHHLPQRPWNHHNAPSSSNYLQAQMLPRVQTAPGTGNHSATVPRPPHHHPCAEGFHITRSSAAQPSNDLHLTPSRSTQVTSDFPPSTPMTPSLLDDEQSSYTSYVREVQSSPLPSADRITPSPIQDVLPRIEDQFSSLEEDHYDPELDVAQDEQDALDDHLSKSTSSLAEGTMVQPPIIPWGSHHSPLSPHQFLALTNHTEQSLLDYLNSTESPVRHFSELARPSSASTITTAMLASASASASNIDDATHMARRTSPRNAAFNHSLRNNKRPREDTPPEEKAWRSG